MTQKLARIRDTSSYGAVVSTTRAAESASVCPWYFPTVDDYTERLERAGFVVPTRARRNSQERHGRIATFAGHNLTNEEEAELVKFLGYLRSKKKPGGSS